MYMLKHSSLIILYLKLFNKIWNSLWWNSWKTLISNHYFIRTNVNRFNVTFYENCALVEYFKYTFFWSNSWIIIKLSLISFFFSFLTQARNENDTNSMPPWIEHFIKIKEQCETHSSIKTYNFTRFCITCVVHLCKSCIEQGHNKDHNLLKIYKNSNEPAALLNEMKCHFDCNDIQVYIVFQN